MLIFHQMINSSVNVDNKFALNVLVYFTKISVVTIKLKKCFRTQFKSKLKYFDKFKDLLSKNALNVHH